MVDHHQCTAALPVAHAVVNPNRLDEEAGAEHGHLAAVGVAFLLGAALLRTLRGRGFFSGRPEPRLIDLLDLVALGTVADVAQLKGLNRAFVAQGLKVMAAGRNPGLAALVGVSRLKRAPQCADLGFALGPRINAGGRVGKSDLGVRLLTTDDPAEAAAIAAELECLNEERRTIEAVVQAEAEALAARQGNRAVVVVAGAGWHPGVIGIVAGRLKEKLRRPVIVIAIDADGTGKGSGRSVGGVDLGGAVLAARDAGLLVAGGGHAMAAGLTIAAGAVDGFAEWIDAHLSTAVAAAGDDRTLLLDAVVACGGVTPRAGRGAGRCRALRHGLAGTADCRGAAARRQGRRGRPGGARPRDHGRRRRPQPEDGRVPPGCRAAWPDAAGGAARPPAVGRRAHQAGRLGHPPRGRTARRRRRLVRLT